MFFGAFLGDNENLASWQELLNQHAAWLGLVPCIESRPLSDGRNFSFGWLQSEPSDKNGVVHETEEFIDLATLGNAVEQEHPVTTERAWQQLATDIHTNTIRIGLSLRSGDLRVVVPPATPEQFYFTRDSRGYVFSNDMRMLMRWTGVDIDERAVYALFQFGAIPPPLTISRNIERVPNGHMLEISEHSTQPVYEVFYQPGDEIQEDTESSDGAEMLVQQTLEDVLAPVPTSTALYFSGGVDSTLLALRLADMGRKDITLVNYTFGPQDPEGHLALQIAAHLGLTCEQVRYEPPDIPTVLGRLGRDYSFPFGDFATLPTNLLVYGSLGSIGQSHVAIEGTGADGAFGLGLKYRVWDRIYSIPGSLRRLLAGGYRWLNLWNYDSRFELLGRAARRSTQMPLQLAGVIGQNALDGIAYTIPGKLSESLEEAIRVHIQVLSTGLDPKEQFTFLDLVHVCAGIFAAKSFDPLRAHGVRPIYPFLEPPMLRLSASLQWSEKCPGGEVKGLLKRILAQRLPQEFIYRPKSAFIPPIRELLTDSSIQAFLQDVVMSHDNPLIHFCREDVVRQMIQRAQRGQPLSYGVYQFLWVLAFTSGWLRQLDF